MCTYNGDAFIGRQLLSIFEQKHRCWRLYVSDDGSNDRTLDILKKLIKRVGQRRVELRSGPRLGFAKNFMSLLTDENIVADYYALSDQDDIWSKEKLCVALKYFHHIESNKPTVYCGRTIIVNSMNEFIGYSDKPVKMTSFRNALVQSIAGGNTMVLNKSARDLIIKYSKDVDIVSHDWWIYILITGCGGDFFYDNLPYVRYRQHDNNLVGMNSDIRARFKRLVKLLNGNFRNWNSINIESLQKSIEYLTVDNKNSLDLFCKARNNVGFVAVGYLILSGIHRQKLIQNITLYLGCFFGKL
jgi:glycosyltransferase involved in cell wall biosynthesis